MRRASTGLLLLAVASFAACSDDLLVQAPPDQINQNDFWRVADDAIKYVNAMYRELPGMEVEHRHETMLSWDVFSDNGFEIATHAPVEIANGSYGPSSLFPELVWSRNYRGIRQANVLLANVDSVDMDPALRERLIGEARFLRAFFYHDLVRFFGGVPLITQPQGLDSTDVARASQEEVVSFILQELDGAASTLPLAYGAEDLGRATRGAALALKSRVLLYDEQWAEAAAAARDVMDLGVYDLFPDYGELFEPQNEDNIEAILAKQYLAPDLGNALDGISQPPGAGGWGKMTPLQSLVDAYECIDGLPFGESPLCDPADPHANRDPRLDATIIHTGSVFKDVVIDTRPGVSPNGINGGPNTGITGYYMRKHLNEEFDPASEGRWNSSTDWILIRYAEVLLNYAEAQNEAVGPSGDVITAIDRIRARAGMPPLPAGLSQAQMRERIRHERRIELAFEGQRYFDIKRWGIGEQVMNGSVYGMEVDGQHIKIEERIWLPRHYLWPIPQSEMNINSALVQNPGW